MNCGVRRSVLNKSARKEASAHWTNERIIRADDLLWYADGVLTPFFLVSLLLSHKANTQSVELMTV